MLLTSFATASSAALAACEMQRRCHGLPSLALHPVPLHVGIHRAAPPRLRRENGTERRDSNRRAGFTIAQELAESSEKDSVLVSGLVFRSLAPEIREHCRQLRITPLGIPAYLVNWRKTRSSQPHSPTHSVRPAADAVRLILRQDSGYLVLDKFHVITTLGRDPACDMTIVDHLVSREHAHIERHAAGFMITDHSTNGTRIVFHRGHEVQLHNDSLLLEESGNISLGRAVSDDSGKVIEFQIHRD